MDGRQTARVGRPGGSAGLPLFRVMEALADATAEALDMICPLPALLEFPPDVLYPQADPPPPSDETRHQAELRVNQLLKSGNVGDATIHFLRSERAVLGSSKRVVDHVLESESVSPVHAELHQKGADWELIALGAQTATFTRGQQLEAKAPARLSGGQPIHLGNCSLVFLLPKQVWRLAQHLVSARRKAPDKELVPATPSLLKFPPEGLLVNEFAQKVRGDPNFFKNSKNNAFLLQVPVEKPKSSGPELAMGKLSGAESHLKGKETTQKWSDDAIQGLRRSAADLNTIRLYALLAGGEGAELSVGRAAGNRVVLTDQSTSSLHALFSRGRDGFWRVMDAGSQNGTWVSKSRIPDGMRVPLPRGGEQVWFGGYRTLFVFPEQVKKLIKGLR